MRDRNLPEITHLQFLVLSALLQREQAGRAVRQAIGEYGVRRSAPAFYQLMARMERDGLIQGWYEPIVVGDQSVTERRYRVTPAGVEVWEQTRAFYESVSVAAGRPRWSNA